MVNFPPLPSGGVVIGVGADLTEIARVREAVERQGDRFLQRVYTPEELAYCLGKSDPYPSLAARFAAKEAVAKAFTTGIGAELGWHSVAVRSGERGQPEVILDEKGEALLRHWQAAGVRISLSHTRENALAVAVILRTS